MNNTVVLIDDIQFNHCIQVQSYVYTNSIQLKKIQSSITISTSLKKIQNISKVQLQLHMVENILRPIQVNWVRKNFKIFSKSNSSKTLVKKFKGSKYTCLVVKCQKNSENILNPNQRWLNKEKFQSLNPKING